MAPSPAPWAVLGDVLWCLGLGCLLGAARDAVRLALGEGPVRCFFRDIAVFAAAAVAAVIAGNTDPSVPINGAELTLFGAAGKRLSDNEIDQLVRGGVTPIETVGGVSSPVRGITTKTSSGGAADTTWRELTTILIVDEVIPTIRSALRTRFARSKNTAQSRGAIRSQVVLELEEMKSREIVDSYGEVLVSALKSDPTVCLVEFSFTVAHGLNRIYLTAHITV
mgnify:CR=1 FL=1